MTDDNVFGDMIFSYSRADAIRDGVLIDVSDTASQAGWKFPVAINDNAYAHIVPSDEVKAKFGCDVEGRLWDVLWMAMIAARTSGGGSIILFDLILPQTKSDPADRLVKMKALCHPGDEGEPVVTIMMPGDD